jgi:hypothetical protein
MENLSKHIKIGEISIPNNYWLMNEDDKEILSITLLDDMLRLIDKKINPKLDRVIVLNQLLDSSIKSNEQDEEYEICEVMYSIKKLLNG